MPAFDRLENWWLIKQMLLDAADHKLFFASKKLPLPRKKTTSNVTGAFDTLAKYSCIAVKRC
jgi:hypothetical protein